MEQLTECERLFLMLLRSLSEQQLKDVMRVMEALAQPSE